MLCNALHGSWAHGPRGSRTSCSPPASVFLSRTKCESGDGELLLHPEPEFATRPENPYGLSDRLARVAPDGPNRRTQAGFREQQGDHSAPFFEGLRADGRSSFQPH